MAACKALYGDTGHQNRGAYVRRFPLQKGMSVLLDVFYRADADVNGVLSIAEFRSFWPSAPSEDQMHSLFTELASSSDASVHASEFCAFVAQHIGAFRDVIPALEELTSAVIRAADDTTESYECSSFRDQFVTRLLARETLLQLATAHAAIEAVCRRLEERQDNAANIANSQDGVAPPSAGDEAHPSESSSSSSSPSPVPGASSKHLASQVERLEALTTQLQKLCGGDDPPGAGGQRVVAMGDQLDAVITKLNRLETLVDKIEEKVEFERVCEDTVDLSQESLLLIVQQKLEVDAVVAVEFKKSLDAYVQDTRLSDGCIYVSVLSYQETPTFIIYEIWDSEDQWARHVRSPVYKAFQHHNIEHLNKPEFFNTLQLPANAFAQIGSSWARGQHSMPT